MITVRVMARMTALLGCDSPLGGGAGGCGRSLLPITRRLYDLEEDKVPRAVVFGLLREMEGK